uniref:Ig-like domain-containing protein n=1 Tax=Sphenodon punctatus TaxID=8508 RepID=A0A8D0HSR2_SPHPU
MEEMPRAAGLKGLPSSTPMATSTPVSGLLLLFLLLTLLLEPPGAGAQELEVLQSKGPISLLAGETLALNCTVTGVGPSGPVKWFKSKTSGRQLIYATAESQQFPRVTWVNNNINTDFSIRISDIRPEDAGIYYCVKFRKASGSSDPEFKSGPGTTVLVIARPSPPAVTGPPSRAEPGASVNFTCTSEGFSPRDITVHWLRNRNRLGPADTTVLPAQESTSYSMSSTVWMTLAPGDVQSQLTCRIEHSTLPRPLEETVGLSHFLRVPPKLRLETTPLPIRLNAIVKITCRADEFYPNDTSLTWLENGNETELGKPVSLLTQKPDGRYSLTSSLEFNAMEQKNLSRFTCRVVHDSQPPANSSVTLKISNLSESDEDSISSQETSHSLLSSPAFWLGLILEKVLVALFLLYLFMRVQQCKPQP